MFLSSAFQTCECVSMKPGMTIMPRASIDLGARRRDRGRDANDRAVADMDVADRDVAEGPVHGDDVAASDHEFAAAWRCGRALRACAGWRGEKRRGTGNAERRAAEEKAPAIRGNAGFAAGAS